MKYTTHICPDCGAVFREDSDIDPLDTPLGRAAAAITQCDIVMEGRSTTADECREALRRSYVEPQPLADPLDTPLGRAVIAL